MKVPVTTGDGRLVELDTDDYPNLVLLPEACEGIDPQLWEMFADDYLTIANQTPMPQQPSTSRAVGSSTSS